MIGCGRVHRIKGEGRLDMKEMIFKISVGYLLSAPDLPSSALSGHQRLMSKCASAELPNAVLNAVLNTCCSLFSPLPGLIFPLSESSALFLISQQSSEIAVFRASNENPESVHDSLTHCLPHLWCHTHISG